MKKASGILLMIAGILDLILASCTILTCWLVFFVTLVWGVLLLLAGIFALVARKKQTKGMYITSIVFSVLSADLLGAVGSILGVISASKKQE